jgi:hypothetical protein
MRNLLNYVAAGAEGLFNGTEWVYDIERMPIDYYLINASTFIGKKGVDVAVKQKLYANQHGKHIICDSGGFQLATEVIEHIDPVGVVEVQNRVADIGFILDVPTMKRARGAGAGGLELDASDEYFEQCLQKTIGNIQKVKDLEKNFSNYAIIQGVSYDQLKRWWEAIKGEDIFDGVGTKGVIFSQVLNGLFFVDSTNVKSHHILGLGAAPRILLVRYFYLLSKKDMKVISYDNTNHIQYSKFMQVVLPFTNCSFNKSDDMELFQEMTGIKISKIKEDPIFHAGIRNLYYYGLQNRLINLLDTPETLRDFIKANFKDMIYYVRMIDDFFDKGADYILKKYPEMSAGVEKKQKANVEDFLI